MTLKQIIKSEGRQMKWIAEKLGINRTSLGSKIKRRHFTISEKMHLADLLKTDMETIENAI